MATTDQPVPMRRRVWRWLGIVLGAGLGFFLALMVIGSFLPEQYEARAQMDLKASPEQVWEALSDYRKHPVTASMSRAVQPLPDEDGLPAWVEDIGSSKITVRTLESRPPTYLQRQFADAAVPMVAVSEVRIEPLEAGCRVTATTQATIRHGTWHVPIFRIMLSITGGLNQGLRDHLAEIARSLGESAHFEQGQSAGQ